MKMNDIDIHNRLLNILGHVEGLGQGAILGGLLLVLCPKILLRGGC
jgi:hypothetical protein